MRGKRSVRTSFKCWKRMNKSQEKTNIRRKVLMKKKKKRTKSSLKELVLKKR